MTKTLIVYLNRVEQSCLDNTEITKINYDSKILDPLEMVCMC